MNYACRHLSQGSGNPAPSSSGDDAGRRQQAGDAIQEATNSSEHKGPAKQQMCAVCNQHRLSKAWRCTKLSILILIECADNDKFAVPSRQYFGQYIAWVEAYITQQVRNQ